jgi:hypothetical protein
MNELISAFQRRLSDHHQRKRFIYRHRDALHFVETYPETSLIIGLISCKPNGFLVNSTVYSTFLGLRKNSCNRNLQQHAFTHDTSFNVEAELSKRFAGVNVPKQNWVKRVFAYGRFDGDTLDSEADIAANHARDVRQKRKPAAPPFRGRPVIEPESPSDADSYFDWFDWD